MDYRGADQGYTCGCLAVRLQACVCGLSLHVRPCLWRTALLQLQLPLVVQYKCYAFTASEMTYTVSGGALNSTHSLTPFTFYLWA